MAMSRSREIFAMRIGGQPTLADRLFDLLATVPPSREAVSDQPAASALRVSRRAAINAAASAGTLALPPGPLGWLTIAPELYAVWRIQAQMVADIAGVHGKHAQLDREQMLHCLFGHTAATSIQGLVVRVGQRYLVRRAPLPALYAIVNKVALRIAQRGAGRVFSRWVPAVGALGVAGYVYVDTSRVADAAMALFAAEVSLVEETVIEASAPRKSTPKVDAQVDAQAQRCPPAGRRREVGRAHPRQQAGARGRLPKAACHARREHVWAGQGEDTGQAERRSLSADPAPPGSP